MKKGLTEIVFILDNSGSMSGLEKDTIGGFNSFIEKQREGEGEAVVSVVLFNTNSSVIYNRKDISKIEPMNDKQYTVGGSTALLDAVGNAVTHIANVHKNEGEDNVPEKTVFVITTDGEENSSREFTYGKIKKMIENETREHGWEFLFLGANIDAAAEADRLGIASERAVRYECDEEGTNLNFACLSESICSIREGRVLDAGWKKEIEKYRKRKGGNK